MLGARGEEEVPTPRDVERGRAEYKKAVKSSSFKDGLLESFGPRACVPGGTSKGCGRRHNGDVQVGTGAKCARSSRRVVRTTLNQDSQR